MADLGPTSFKRSTPSSQVNMEFIKVQLLITTIMTLFSLYSESYFLFQIQHIGLFYVAVVLALIIEIYIFCCEGGRKFPQNMVLTFLFTLCEGYIVSFVASITGKTSGNGVVFMAAFMTLMIAVACTFYAIYSKEDYTTSSALLVVLSIALLVLFIIMLFTDSPFIHALYCCIGTFLFGCYLVIDTQMIVGGRTIELSMDEEYVGAMLLYIDIIMIFMYLLQLFGNR